jgi:hypothetical protein
MGYCDADLQISCYSGYAVLQTRCEPPSLPGATAKCIEVGSRLACSSSGPGPIADGGAD